MTKRQKEVLNYIGAFIFSRGYSPSYKEIAHALGVRSLATVSKHVHALEKQGLISISFNGSRTITIKKPVDAAVAAERERCAKIAEEADDFYVGNEIAARIRSGI